MVQNSPLSTKVTVITYHKRGPRLYADAKTEQRFCEFYHKASKQEINPVEASEHYGRKGQSSFHSINT